MGGAKSYWDLWLCVNLLSHTIFVVEINNICLVLLGGKCYIACQISLKQKYYRIPAVRDEGRDMFWNGKCWFCSQFTTYFTGNIMWTPQEPHTLCNCLGISVIYCSCRWMSSSRCSSYLFHAQEADLARSCLNAKCSSEWSVLRFNVECIYRKWFKYIKYYNTLSDFLCPLCQWFGFLPIVGLRRCEEDLLV